MKFKKLLAFLGIVMLAVSSGFARDLRRDGPRDSRDPSRIRVSERGALGVGRTGEYPRGRAPRSVLIAIDSETGEIYRFGGSLHRRNT